MEENIDIEKEHIDLDSLKVHMPDMDTPLEKENIAVWVDKKDLLDKEVLIKPLFIASRETNFDGNIKTRKYLSFMDDGEQKNVNISKSNNNELIDLLGNDMKLWKDKALIMTGKSFEGSEFSGVSVVFKLP